MAGTEESEQFTGGPETGYYVYGVVRADADRVPEGLVGVDGAAVQTVEHGPVAAVVGLIGLDRPPGRRADLVAHSEVLDKLVASGPVVPVQFGSVLDDEETVRDGLLREQGDLLRQTLENLRVDSFDTGLTDNLRGSVRGHDTSATEF